MGSNSVPQAHDDEYSDVKIGDLPTPDVRYTSGEAIYVERYDGDRWMSHYWSATGRINVQRDGWEEDAFDLNVDGKPCVRGWDLVSASEEARTSAGSRHVVVELSHKSEPVTIKLHTTLDGTPVIARWLDVTNTSDEPVSLRSVSPWAGRLWPGRNFTLGYFRKDGWACEGWFDWSPVDVGATLVQCDKGQGFDDPFFIVRNEVNGKYFIGHLAWSANWKMAFSRHGGGLS